MKGTPFHLELLIWSTAVAKVGVTESSGTPLSSLYPGFFLSLSDIYCPITTSLISIGDVDFNTLTLFNKL